MPNPNFTLKEIKLNTESGQIGPKTTTKKTEKIKLKEAHFTLETAQISLDNANFPIADKESIDSPIYAS